MYLCLNFVKPKYVPAVKTVAPINLAKVIPLNVFALSATCLILFLICSVGANSCAAFRMSLFFKILASTFGSKFLGAHKALPKMYLYVGNPPSHMAWVPNSSINLSLPSNLSPAR